MQPDKIVSIRVKRTSQARDIAGNPQPCHTPGLRLFAWIALKAERGQTVHQHRLQLGPRASTISAG